MSLTAHVATNEWGSPVFTAQGDTDIAINNVDRESLTWAVVDEGTGPPEAAPQFGRPIEGGEGGALVLEAGRSLYVSAPYVQDGDEVSFGLQV